MASDYGAALRRAPARHPSAAGLSLHGVEEKSQAAGGRGRFSYERGDRAVTVQKPRRARGLLHRARLRAAARRLPAAATEPPQRLIIDPSAWPGAGGEGRPLRALRRRHPGPARRFKQRPGARSARTTCARSPSSTTSPRASLPTSSSPGSPQPRGPPRPGLSTSPTRGRCRAGAPWARGTTPRARRPREAPGDAAAQRPVRCRWRCWCPCGARACRWSCPTPGDAGDDDDELADGDAVDLPQAGVDQAHHLVGAGGRHEEGLDSSAQRELAAHPRVGRERHERQVGR